MTTKERNKIRLELLMEHISKWAQKHALDPTTGLEIIAEASEFFATCFGIFNALGPEGTAELTRLIQKGKTAEPEIAVPPKRMLQ